MHTPLSFIRISVFALTASILLTSCGSTPTSDNKSAEAQVEISLEHVTETLAAADSKTPEERAYIYMNVVQALLEAEETDWARNTLAQLSPATIPQEQHIRYAVLSAALAMAQGQPYLAKRYLWDEGIVATAEISPLDERIKFHEMRAQLLYVLAEFRNSVTERVILSDLIEANTEASVDNLDRLWQTMMELPYSDLKLESQLQTEMIAKGWYTLAALSKDNQTNLKQQITAVENWMLNWPEHPASLTLPADLQLLRQLVDDQPRHIALLLPFSGRFESAAEAIRDGIMAAYYDAVSSGDFAPTIRVYDTTSTDINSLYDSAVLEGAQLIIGPLEQSKIAEIALRPELPVPTLALNRLTGPLDSSEGLFQFGLPLEDEAEQVAEQAWRDGHRRAMILAPSTSNGDRSVKSFSERWVSLGGEITHDYRYKNPSSYSNLVKSAVKVQESQSRKNRVRSIIGKNVEFEPRRRKDVDFIFLYSQASQARLLKPLLSFHRAGDIPVYAIKDVYAGKIDRKRDRDLNNIRFTTLPWFFDSDLPEKRAISQHSQKVSYQFLYALGVDAYHIHPRLRQLKEVKQAHFYGATGKLQLDEKLKIKREQIWAKFNNGVAVPVASFTSENDI